MLSVKALRLTKRSGRPPINFQTNNCERPAESAWRRGGDSVLWPNVNDPKLGATLQGCDLSTKAQARQKSAMLHERAAPDFSVLP